MIVFPGFSCGACEFCVRGERTLCLRYGYLGAHKDGGYAELVRVPAANCLPLPESVSFEAGAALPLAFLTSWHALVVKAELRPGQTVLVQAAGSGIGSAAIQIARLIGARVMTTVGSDDKIEFARGLGAERVVNYRTQDFVEEAKKWTNKRGVDVVIEHIGGETFERSSYALTRLGTLVSIGSHDTHWGRLDLRHVYSKNLRIVGTNLGTILELRTLLELRGRRTPEADHRPRLPAERRTRRPCSTCSTGRTRARSCWCRSDRAMTLARLLELAAARRPAAEAVVDGGAPPGLRVAPGPGDASSAADFARRGVGPGDRVLIALRNRLEHVLAYWALQLDRRSARRP